MGEVLSSQRHVKMKWVIDCFAEANFGIKLYYLYTLLYLLIQKGGILKKLL